MAIGAVAMVGMVLQPVIRVSMPADILITTEAMSLSRVLRVVEFPLRAIVIVVTIM